MNDNPFRTAQEAPWRTVANKGGEAPTDLSTSITRLLESIEVFPELAFPPRNPLVSMKIVVCLPVLLLDFLSARTGETALEKIDRIARHS